MGGPRLSSAGRVYFALTPPKGWPILPRCAFRPSADRAYDNE